MKLRILLVLILFGGTVQSQNSLELIAISQAQLRLMPQARTLDSLTRINLFKDSIYAPYASFWNGYLGDADDVSRWLNESMGLVAEWEKKNGEINGNILIEQLQEVARGMAKLTGYTPKGRWYIVYGPAWTDLGGLGDFAMLIDLAHGSNSSNERIMRMFPHELTHQIMTNVNRHPDSSSIASIIGEGFAVWMNQKYWGKKYTLAENLGYSEEELHLCDKNRDALNKFLTSNAFTTNRDVINVFRDRSERLNERLPGAIGYYLGYQVVEMYVRKFGKNSWRDIFVKSPKEIYELSGYGQ